MKLLKLAIVLLMILTVSCTENYSNGNRIGLITQFSKAGLLFKTYEGHLNPTQTGMNSGVPFDFSIDRDNEPQGLVNTLDSAARFGWKVDLTYHLVKGYNWFGNRGATNYFITKCEIVDRNMSHPFSNPNTTNTQPSNVLFDRINLENGDTLMLIMHKKR